MSITLVVSDDPEPFAIDHPVIGFDRYLAEYPKRGEPRTRVINLCDTSRYLSSGYYCSLLAEARSHRVLPSVTTINDLRGDEGGVTIELPGTALPTALPEAGLLVMFGWSPDPLWRRLARLVFERYPAPLLRVHVEARAAEGEGAQLRVERERTTALDGEARSAFCSRLAAELAGPWRRHRRRRQHRWDLAILVDPQEAQPPSDEKAIRRFLRAADKVGMAAECITPADAHRILEFDALFIRQTTAIDHPTYRLARRAEQEGMIVIDDPRSILRCCNKVFLHDAFSYGRVPTPQTRIVSAGDDVDTIEAEFGYPLVLKMPESSFSSGVFRAQDRRELEDGLARLFKTSALALVQRWLPTAFDWRIGVLGGRAIYACRYFMARGHWQIYEHRPSGEAVSGAWDTLPTFEVPKKVLRAAVRAAAIVGDGLYGVDLKQVDGHVYVIEVNDNPSIERDVEDRYLGDELYMVVMQEFADRLEARGRTP
ncbi:MAG: RimK family protein [Pseudomonadales bacterium]|jgi:glutathione synthase/RimK-type ligase-like ATP-grasp enzyme|nr:RimK family protein [Pseudomonadales bacterium]